MPKLATRLNSNDNDWKPLSVSKHAQNTVNPIRRVTDCMSVAANPDKEPIRLNLGDPTLTGCLPPSEATIQAIKNALDSHKFDGYGPAIGMESARAAIMEVLICTVINKPINVLALLNTRSSIYY